MSEDDDDEEWFGLALDAIVEGGVPLWCCLVVIAVLLLLWLRT